MNPSVDQVKEFIRSREPGGVSTMEIVLEFRARDFDVDRIWFWREIAPALIADDFDGELVRRQ